MLDVLKSFENERFKVTVAERSDGKWIATLWNKESSYEVDATVKVFETSGGALYEAFDLLVEILEGK